jgi:hypothetical protein
MQHVVRGSQASTVNALLLVPQSLYTAAQHNSEALVVLLLPAATPAPAAHQDTDVFPWALTDSANQANQQHTVSTRPLIGLVPGTGGHTLWAAKPGDERDGWYLRIYVTI